MRILEGPAEQLEPQPGAVLTIGNFDGVHRGHQKIFARVVAEARRLGGPSVLITFKPHPTKILNPGKSPPMITTREQRYRLFADAGLAVAVVLPFTLEFARTPAEAFVEEIVVGRFRPRKIIIGTPFRFGHQRAGDVALLQRLGRRFGFEAEGISEVDAGGETISSTRIRRALLEGRIGAATSMLGRPLELTGTVVPGERRGRRLGVPTANLELENELLPPDGVYVTRLRHGAQLLGSVTNIGTRPTFPGGRRVVETHILDFHRDLYGERVGLQVLEHLREEIRFPTPEALADQIRTDVERARAFLAAAGG